MSGKKEELKAMADFVAYSCTTGVPGLQKEFEQLERSSGATYATHTFKSFNANPSRNRYEYALCPDATRVVLTQNVPPDTDYINANWIRYGGVEKPFIATQGPTEATAGDFWRMVFQEGQNAAPAVVMLSQLIEEGASKCFPYWPLQPSAFKTYGSVQVTNKSVQPVDRFIAYTLELLPDGCSNSVVITLYHYGDWLNVPKSPMSVLRLLRTLRANKLCSGPMIVHCSAGLSRVGAFIAIEVALLSFMRGKQPNVRQIVERMRVQRPGMVRHVGQYVFIYACLLYYINAKTSDFKDEVVRFHESFVSSGLL